MSQKYADVVVSPQGEITFIYNDALQPLALQGEVTPCTRRASHVEPFDELRDDVRVTICHRLRELHPEWEFGGIARQIRTIVNGKWFADLTPSKGPVLGPFDNRQAALDAEIAWINHHILKVTHDDSDGTGPNGEALLATYERVCEVSTERSVRDE